MELLVNNFAGVPKCSIIEIVLYFQLRMMYFGLIIQYCLKQKIENLIKKNAIERTKMNFTHCNDPEMNNSQASLKIVIHGSEPMIN